MAGREFIASLGLAGLIYHAASLRWAKGEKLRLEVESHVAANSCFLTERLKILDLLCTSETSSADFKALKLQNIQSGSSAEMPETFFIYGKSSLNT